MRVLCAIMTLRLLVSALFSRPGLNGDHYCMRVLCAIMDLRLPRDARRKPDGLFVNFATGHHADFTFDIHYLNWLILYTEAFVQVM